MLGSLIRGVGGAVQTGINAVGDVAEASTDILACLADGEKPNNSDIMKLTSAGWTVAEIATFYGVATHVIEEMSS